MIRAGSKMLIPLLLLISVAIPTSSFFTIPPVVPSTSLSRLSPSSTPSSVLHSKEPTHDVRSGYEGDIDPEELTVQARLAEHQKGAARLDFPTGESMRKIRGKARSGATERVYGVSTPKA